MELVEIDAIDSKPAQRVFAGGAQVVGAAVGRPADQPPGGRFAAGAGAFVAAFGRDQEVVVGEERFGDELFRDPRAVGIRRVDELDTQLDGSA
jgi:hypothetical protein